MTFEIAAEGWSGGIGGPASFNTEGHTGLAFINVDNVVTGRARVLLPGTPPSGQPSTTSPPR